MEKFEEALSRRSMKSQKSAQSAPLIPGNGEESEDLVLQKFASEASGGVLSVNQP